MPSFILVQEFESCWGGGIRRQQGDLISLLLLFFFFPNKESGPRESIELVQLLYIQSDVIPENSEKM
jgi:hypothetical protein